MKNIFIGFFALIFINISCKKNGNVRIDKKYIVNQTQHDLTLTFEYEDNYSKNISINLLKNSIDSFEFISGYSSSFEYHSFRYIRYKNITLDYYYFMNINFNTDKSIKFDIRTRVDNDSFFKIYYSIDDTSIFRENIRLMDYIDDDVRNKLPNKLYLLPTLYDSAR